MQGRASMGEVVGVAASLVHITHRSLVRVTSAESRCQASSQTVSAFPTAIHLLHTSRSFRPHHFGLYRNHYSFPILSSLLVAMLDTIPSEVLSHIALHLSLPTCAPSVPLLLTSRTIHATLSPASNPRLYARIFRASFDVSAAERRLGDLNAVAFAAELKRRVGSLRRLSRQVRDGDVKEVREEDLWVLYVMLVENGE